MNLRQLTKRILFNHGMLKPFGNLHVLIDSVVKYCRNTTFLDVGAGDGLYQNNVAQLVSKNWNGTSVECDNEKFAQLAKNYSNYDVDLLRIKATPENAHKIITRDFSFLSIDIDGHDACVLRSILLNARPDVIICEINEKYEPPFEFEIEYSHDYKYIPESRMWGMSLQTAVNICSDYNLLALDYINAIFIHKSHNTVNTKPENAFYDGFVNAKNRTKLLPWTEKFRYRKQST